MSAPGVKRFHWRSKRLPGGVTCAKSDAKSGDIVRFLNEKQSWLEENYAKMVQRNKVRMAAKAKYHLSDSKIHELAEQAVEVVPKRVAHYAARMGVTYGRITIRHQRTRWGSCSSNGNLNFNCLLMLAPPEVLDYVVVHELCHRKYMNHSKQFWAEVAKVNAGL